MTRTADTGTGPVPMISEVPDMFNTPCARCAHGLINCLCDDPLPMPATSPRITDMTTDSVPVKKFGDYTVTLDSEVSENGNRFAVVTDAEGTEIGAASFREEDGTVAVSPFTDADGGEIDGIDHAEVTSWISTTTGNESAPASEEDTGA